MTLAISTAMAGAGRRLGLIARLLSVFLLAGLLAGCNDDDDKKKLKIVTEPADVAVLVGQTATFTVEARGKQLAYQWQRNGVAIANATSASYTTPATVAGDGGAKFTAVVTSGQKTVTSREATLTVNVPPSISTQPAAQTVDLGATATFSVTAAGTAPLSYQWRRNGTDIAGATAASYTTAATVAGDDGAQFSVVVSSPHGTVTSGGALLTVRTPGSSFNGTWQSKDTLDALDGEISQSIAAVNRTTGDGLVVWIQEDATKDTVFVREYTASTSSWGSATRLYEAPTAQVSIYMVDPAINPAGEVVVAWTEYDGNSSSFVRGVRRTPAGAWGSVVDLTPAGVNGTDYVEVGIDAAGTATVGWSQGFPSLVAVADWPIGAAPGAPQLLESAAESGESEYSNVVVDDDGNVTVAWRREEAGSSDEQIVVRRRPAGQAWSAVEVIADIAGRVDYPDAAVDPVSGNVLLAWNEEPSGQAPGIRYSVLDRSAGTWSAPAPTEPGAPDAGWVEVAASDAGFGAIAWQNGQGPSDPAIKARLVDMETGTLDAVTHTVSNGGWFPHVGVNAWGDMIATYYEPTFNRDTVYARYIPRTGTGSVTQLSTNLTWSRVWNVAMTSNGESLVAWEEGFVDSFQQYTSTGVFARWFR